MEKVLNIMKWHIIVCALVFLSCNRSKLKQSQKNQDDNISSIKESTPIKTKENTIDLNCLIKSDNDMIVVFKDKLEKAILKKDTLGILNLIDFSIYDIGDMPISQQKIEFISDIQEVMTHCLKSTMDEGDLQIVEQEEYFTKKGGDDPNCLLYGISNSFPELEFDVTFLIGKINGEIKIIEIKIIG